MASRLLQPNKTLYQQLLKSYYKLYELTTCMPIMLRIAWHDAGTYSKQGNTGGPNASIRFKREMNHGANAGLAYAQERVEEAKLQFPEVSYADLIQAAGYTAVSFCKGPEMLFRFGRADSVNDDSCTPEDRLPDATQGAEHLREVFSRMGLNDVEIVALSGGHTLGKAHKERSGFEGPWTVAPEEFDNSYFVELLSGKRAELLRLPTDEALLKDNKFKYWVEAFARDNHLFFQEYAKAHQKLSELGCN